LLKGRGEGVPGAARALSEGGGLALAALRSLRSVVARRRVAYRRSLRATWAPLPSAPPQAGRRRTQPYPTPRVDWVRRPSGRLPPQAAGWTRREAATALRTTDADDWIKRI